jgi:hypothetical protein
VNQEVVLVWSMMAIFGFACCVARLTEKRIPAEPEFKSTFTVATFNVFQGATREGGINFVKVRDILEEHNPDIIGSLSFPLSLSLSLSLSLWVPVR